MEPLKNLNKLSQLACDKTKITLLEPLQNLSQLQKLICDFKLKGDYKNQLLEKYNNNYINIPDCFLNSDEKRIKKELYIKYGTKIYNFMFNYFVYLCVS